MNIALVGYGVEGQSSYKYWSAKGANITICDSRSDLVTPEGANVQLGEHYLDDLERFDLIVRTAGMNPSVILSASPTVKPKITTLINEFLSACPTKHVIGITGTKGKGTTTTLTAKMLEAAGKTVFVGGNIGVSPFDFFDQLTSESWVVLELSSFQLYDVKHAPHIAVCLMMAPEHLNWHTDMQDYLDAKANLFKNQTSDDIAVYYSENDWSKEVAAHSPGKKINYYATPGAHIENDAIVIDGQTICQTSEIKLLGRHNWQNACAATTAVWQAVPDAKAIRSVLTSFTGLEHRLEFVREHDGIRYYNDSFGTTPETAIVAIQAFEQPKVVILGGADKKSHYDELAKVVKDTNVRHVVLIGEMGEVIGRQLAELGYTHTSRGGTTMNEIMAATRAAAKSGDVVLLSTACASFGMFKDYKDRGQQFKSAVNAL